MWKTLLKVIVRRRDPYRAELPPTREGGSLARSSCFRGGRGWGSGKQICWSGKPGWLRTLIHTWEATWAPFHCLKELRATGKPWDQWAVCHINLTNLSGGWKEKTEIPTSKYRAVREEITQALGYGVYCREAETTWLSQGLPPSCNVGWKKPFSVYHLTVCRDHFSCNSAIYQEERWQVLWDWGWIPGAMCLRCQVPWRYGSAVRPEPKTSRLLL